MSTVRERGGLEFELRMHRTIATANASALCAAAAADTAAAAAAPESDAAQGEVEGSDL